MRRHLPLLAFVALLSLSLTWPAHADRIMVPAHGEPEKKATFWERVQSPHLDEIRRLVGEAVFLRQNVATQYWDQYLLPARRRVLRDALERYESALALDPRRLDLRLDAAHTALEAG